MNLRLIKTAFSGAIIMGLSAGVFAANADREIRADFCSNETECFYAFVDNEASVTVTSVNITQQDGKQSCAKVEKTVKQNLAGGTGMDPGQNAKWAANPVCRYKVVFKTTKGCTGDKVAHLKPSHMADDRNVVKLQGACGTLRAGVAKRGKDTSENVS
ncbi:MAG: hypothetical protein AAGL90_02640 [Pseudomonadota bacterium]